MPCYKCEVVPQFKQKALQFPNEGLLQKLIPVLDAFEMALAAAGRPVYLLVAMPMRQDWASTLMAEFGELDRAFTLEPVTRYPELGLYRLKPR